MLQDQRTRADLVEAIVAQDKVLVSGYAQKSLKGFLSQRHQERPRGRCFQQHNLGTGE